MRKIFKPIADDSIAVGADAIKARPVLAHRMMVIVQKSSMINVLLANALSLILGIEAKPAITMLAAITNDGARTAAMKAIGSELLKTDQEKKEFEKILKKFSAYERHRNRIAHGIWVAVKSRPDILLYASQADYIKWKAALNVAGAKDDTQEYLRLLTSEDSFYANLEIYDEKEFENIECMYDLLKTRIDNFAFSFLGSN